MDLEQAVPRNKRAREYQSSYRSSKRQATEALVSGTTVMETTTTTVAKRSAKKKSKTSKTKKYTHPAFIKVPRGIQHNTWDVATTKALMTVGTVSAGGGIDWLICNAIPQSVGGQARSESKVRIHSLWCKGIAWIPYTNTDQKPIEVRIIVFVDSQSNGSSPGSTPNLQIQNLLNNGFYEYLTNQNTAPTQNTSVNEPLAFTLADNRQRFKILRDELMVFDYDEGITNNSARQTTRAKYFDFYTKLEIDTTYNGTTAVAGSINTNSIWVLMMSNSDLHGSNDTSHAPQIRMRSRVTFTDIQ